MEVGRVVGEHGDDEESAFDEVDMTPYWWMWGWGIDVAKDRRFYIAGAVVVGESDGRKREIGCACQGIVHGRTC